MENVLLVFAMLVPLARVIVAVPDSSVKLIVPVYDPLFAVILPEFRVISDTDPLLSATAPLEVLVLLNP